MLGSELTFCPAVHTGGKGFAFATWLRLEDATFQPGTCGRSLFNLLHRSSEEVRGLSVAMKGTPLALCSLSKVGMRDIKKLHALAA